MGSDDLSSVRSHALRLLPGEDLRLALEEATRRLALQAGCILTCVGSLARARLRLAGGNEALALDGPLEIVSLVGTLSPDGPHLHVALADSGGRVHGGHLLEGCPIYTTAEIVIGAFDGFSFARERDPDTGWRELSVRRRS